MTLFVNGEGEVGDVEKLSSGRDVLVEIMKQKCFCVFRLMSYARDGSVKKKRGKEVEPGLLTIWGVTGHAWGLVMLSEEEE